MKKTTILTLLLLLVVMLTAQQTVTLKFTSITSGGSYYPFDVVNVTNVTRGWTESLAYPDTTMVLTSHDGIQESFDDSGFLSEVYPNPLSGTANVMFGMKQPGNINAKILSTNGSVLSEYNDYLEEGSHQITINISEPQMAFLVVKTNDNQYVKKLLNVSDGNDNSIAVNKISNVISIDKTRNGGDFVIGDVMSYMAVSFNCGQMIESERITKAQYSDEIITLFFNINPNPTTPTVTTSIVTNITENSATAGGNVINDGGSLVTERGVCWSTNPNPTASGTHMVASTAGTGAFTCQLTGLTSGTTYYIRAYAINSQGPSYGNDEVFTTDMNLPIVTIDEITDITTISAIVHGNVTDSGGTYIYERGFCWSTNHNPTTNNSHIICGSGTGVFSGTIKPLQGSTTYYVRAFANIEGGTTYGSEMSFETAYLPQGALNGAFSISSTQQVYFSKGNLQYQASTNTWKFADHQYDCIGDNNANISPTYSGWIDLFGWGTGNNPTNTSTNDNDYTVFVDWGTNIISNGASDVIWRSMSFNEWNYILAQRVTASGVRFARATVNGVMGIIIPPDNWNNNIYMFNYPNSNNASFSINTFSLSEWELLESYGAVFLGLYGYRHGTTVSNVGEDGYYWLAVNPRWLKLTELGNVFYQGGPSYGQSVRLACAVISCTLPTITSNNITNVTQTSAVSGGNVTSDGGGTVTSRGVCWSTNQSPTISDMHTTDGSGLGVFTSNITGLCVNTTYYVRAYATNAAGTSYGEQKTFTTEQASLPTIITSNITNITSHTAASGGNVTSDGNGTISARGVCWGTTQNPTLTNQHTVDGNGLGSFASMLTGLNENTTYYVRAYATNQAGTSYGEQKSFTTLSGGSGNFPTGAINSLFSVSATLQVYFSQGNLQYQASTSTWKFADHQWDYIGTNTAYTGQPGGTVPGSSNNGISQTYNGWIDLFGWATSGYNHGATCYQPWSTSISSYDYYAYGDMNYNLYDQTCKADWGYNAISNGGNIENYWRTLTINEWEYVFDLRNTLSGVRYAKAQINEVNGVILLPDNWNNSYYTLNNTNSPNVDYTTNIISQTNWENYLESNGAVFLPTTGYRYSHYELNHVTTKGFYWSASKYNNLYASRVQFDTNSMITNDHGERRDAVAVRLVHNAE